MQFTLPNQSVSFEIPDEWWQAAGMNGFAPKSGAYRSSASQHPTAIVRLVEIAPVVRSQGVRWFDRDRMVKILEGFVADDTLPPVPVHKLPSGPFPYGLRDGFHRFYASAAASFEALPIEILPYFDISTGQT